MRFGLPEIMRWGLSRFTAPQLRSLLSMVMGTQLLTTSRQASADTDDGATLEAVSGITYTLTDSEPLAAGFTLMGPPSGSATIAVAGTATINGKTDSITVNAGQIFSAVPRKTAPSAYLGRLS